MSETPDPPLDEEVARAWVLDALEALDDQSFVFVLSTVAVLTRALLIEEPRPETIELSGAIDVYLRTRGVALPF